MRIPALHSGLCRNCIRRDDAVPPMFKLWITSTEPIQDRIPAAVDGRGGTTKPPRIIPIGLQSA
jgi:hypothetical protein